MIEQNFTRLAFIAFIPLVALSAQQKTKIYSFTEKEVTPPRLVSKGKPEVSKTSQEARRKGVVRLQIVISEKATVQVTKVIQGLGKVQDAAAIDAASVPSLSLLG